MIKKVMTMFILAVATTAMYAQKDAKVVENEANYEFNATGMLKTDNGLARYLYLTPQQKDEVDEILSEFLTDMSKASNATDARKARKLARRATSYNLHQMGMVLSEWQYERYKDVVYVTMENRGIDY